jgi:hypothetical protein
MLYQWNDHASEVLKKCFEYFVSSKVFQTASYFEQTGMIKMMKHLTGKVDISLIWELSYSTRGKYAQPLDLLASCAAEVFGTENGTGADNDAVEGVKNALFPLYSFVEKPKTISNALAEPYQEAIKNKDAAKLKFLLDVSDDEQWDKEQLFCELLNRKLYKLIIFLGLCDQASKLKEYRLYPLFYNLDTDQYPELAEAVYSCLSPEKVQRYIFSKGLLKGKMSFLIKHGMSEDTPVYAAKKIRITFGGFMKFITETVAYADTKNCNDKTTAAMLNHLRKIRNIYMQTQKTSSAAGIEAAAP